MIQTNDILAAVYMARAFLADPTMEGRAGAMEVARKKYGPSLSDPDIYTLAHALSGFGMQVRGDFTGMPEAGSEWEAS